MEKFDLVRSYELRHRNGELIAVYSLFDDAKDAAFAYWLQHKCAPIDLYLYDYRILSLCPDMND